MINVSINDESRGRLYEALGEIDVCCDTSDNYTEWFDVAMECIVAILEDLDDLQIYRTCAAVEEYVRDNIENENDININKGVAKALETALLDYIDCKEKFILECNLDDDEYDNCEAVKLKDVFNECYISAKELCEEIGA